MPRPHGTARTIGPPARGDVNEPDLVVVAAFFITAFILVLVVWQAAAGGDQVWVIAWARRNGTSGIVGRRRLPSWAGRWRPLCRPRAWGSPRRRQGDRRFFCRGGSTQGLSLLFAFTVLFGGLIYSATRRPREVEGAAGAEIQFQGYVWSFLLATGLTFWAVSGQMIALGVAVVDLVTQGSLTWFTAWVFWAVLVLAGVFLVFYAVMTIVDALQYQSDRGMVKALNEAAERREKELSEAAASQRAPRLAPLLPDWSLP